MLNIRSLKCIYDTKAHNWAIELAFDGDVSAKRVDVDGAEDAEMILEAFDEATAAAFDPESGEIHFSFEYASLEEEEDEEEGDEEEGDEEEEEEDEDQKPKA